MHSQTFDKILGSLKHHELLEILDLLKISYKQNLLHVNILINNKVYNMYLNLFTKKLILRDSKIKKDYSLLDLIEITDEKRCIINHIILKYS